MAIINAKSQFDLESLDNQIIGIAADLGSHDSGMHSHNRSQLLFSSSGCMTIRSNNIQSVLPPTLAAWIPAGVSHCARMRNVVAYRSLYFDTNLISDLPETLQIISVNSLLRELIERMAFWSWDKPSSEQETILALFREELQNAPRQKLQLPLPYDKRLKPWLNQILNGNKLPELLNEMTKSVGASAKTISRIFVKETGIPYQDWRQQWRLHKGIEYLSEGYSVSDVAYSLNFSSDSAFISFFRKQTGKTPGKFS